MIYTFENTPELAGVQVKVEIRGNKIHFDCSGPDKETYQPFLQLYFDWFNRLRPITVHEGANVYSLYLPPIPSGGDSRLLEGIFRDKLFGYKTPRAVTIGVTADCQYKCIHCSAEDYSCHSGDILSGQEIEKVIAEGIALGLTNITFTGGEPLLRSDLNDLIKCVPKDKAVTQIFTNAGFLNSERAASLKSSGLQVIKVSLDSPDPSEHDRFRRCKGAFDAVERGIRYALEAGLLVGLSTYATNESVKENSLKQIASLAAEWGAHEVSVFDVIPTGRLLHNDEILMTENTRKDLLAQAKSLNREYKGNPRIVTQTWTNSYAGFAAYFGCLAGTYQYHISPFGEFTPCDFTPISFGNIRSETTRSLWEKMTAHPAYCEHKRECRMQSPAFRQKYIHNLPRRSELPVPIEKLDEMLYINMLKTNEDRKRQDSYLQDLS